MIFSFHNCMKYCDCRTWHAFQSSEFVSHDNRCVIFYKLRNYRVFIYHKAKPDLNKCASVILKVFQLKIFVNRHILCIKMTPKFIMFEDATTQFFVEFNHPALDRIECATVRSICCQEKRIKVISTKCLIKQFIVSSYLEFSSRPSSTVPIITFFYSCL